MAGSIAAVNLKDGMPSVEEARSRLTTQIHAARQKQIKILKIVHGYGSTGVGGELRIALQSTLRQMVTAGDIRECIYGENWRTSDERTWKLLKEFPDLKSDSDLGRGNRGITVVLL